MIEEAKPPPMATVRPIHPEPLLTRFWPAFVAYTDELVRSGDLDCAFGFQARCGNIGGCDLKALSRAIRQHLGRLDWPVSEPATLRPRDILDLVAFFVDSVAAPAWDLCGLCGQRHIVSGDDAVAQANYTSTINDMFRRFDQPFRLQGGKIVNSSTVPLPALVEATQEIEGALGDADLLMRSHGAPRAVDRVHTALHGYLKVLCNNLPDCPGGRASITELFKTLRKHHPALQGLGEQQVDQVEKVLKALSSVIDALNPIRNEASPAHPGGVLADSEAVLVINAAKTIFGYLAAKQAEHAPRDA